MDERQSRSDAGGSSSGEERDWRAVVLEAMHDGVVVQDADGRIVHANASACRILGLVQDELTGRSSFDPRWGAIREDGSPLAGDEHPAMVALRTGAPCTAVVIGIVRPGGERRWLVVNAQPLASPDGGRPASVIVTFTDITEVSATRDALRRSEESLRRAQGVAHLGSWDWDIAAGTLTWSDEVYRLFGFASDAFDPSYERFLALLDPDDARRLDLAVHAALDGKAPYRVDHRVVRPDGQERFVHEEAEVVRDAAGRPLRMIGTVHDITEAWHVTEALRRSEGMLAKAQRLAHLGSFEWLLATGALSWSDEMFRICGFEPGAFAPDLARANTVTHPDDRDRVRAALVAAAEAGVPCVVEHRIVRPDGTMRFVQTRGDVEQLGDRVRRFVGIVHDVTEQREAELELRRTQAAVEATGEALFRVRRDGSFSAVNAEACARLGYSREELLSMSVWDIDPDVRPQDWRSLWVGFAAGKATVFDAVHRRADGSTLPVEMSVSVFRFGDEELLVAFARDITSRRRAQEALRRSEERLRRAQRTARVGDWELSLADGALVWSDETARLLENDPAEAPPRLSALLGRLLEPGSRERIEDVVAHAQSLEGEQTLDVTARLPSGRLAHFALTVAPERKAGRVDVLHGTVQDVTERVEAERHRQHLLELEREARERLEQANRAKDYFLATLSHELRTPMATILAWVQMLRRGSPPPEKLQRGLERIERAAVAQNQLISDLLDVSRIVSGKLDLVRQPMLLAGAVQGAVEGLRPLATARGVVVETQVRAPDLVVYADPSRLQQVFGNLVSNAVKFTPAGGRALVTVEELAQPSAAAPGRVRVTVADTGAGMKPEFIPHVFDRFAQEDPSSTRDHGGLGLGLAIAHDLVRMHGGTLTAESAGRNCGSTFTVEFPTVAEAELRLPSPDSSAADVRLDGLRVLLVEDDPSARESFTELLRSAGASVEALPGAAPVLAHLREGHWDALVSDVAMPEVDGYALLRRVRALPPSLGGDVPALALTAYAGRDDVHAALDAGFNAHLPKPVDAATLLSAVRRLSDARPAVR